MLTAEFGRKVIDGPNSKTVINGPHTNICNEINAKYFNPLTTVER